MKEITISPITRLEGHGKISIFLDGKGNVAKALMRGGKVSDGFLNMVEMAFRAYDPYLVCAIHFAAGQMPLQMNIHHHEGKLLKNL